MMKFKTLFCLIVLCLTLISTIVFAENVYLDREAGVDRYVLADRAKYSNGGAFHVPIEYVVKDLPNPVPSFFESWARVGNVYKDWQWFHFEFDSQQSVWKYCVADIDCYNKDLTRFNVYDNNLAVSVLRELLRSRDVYKFEGFYSADIYDSIYIKYLGNNKYKLNYYKTREYYLDDADAWVQNGKLIFQKTVDGNTDFGYIENYDGQNIKITFQNCMSPYIKINNSYFLKKGKI